MKIGMRLHDFPRTTPETLARMAREHGFEAGQLAMQKALSLPEDTLLADATLARIRKAFEAEGVAIPVLGCYIDPVGEDKAACEAAARRFCAHVEASAKLGAGCVGTETSHFRRHESERPAAYRDLLDFVARACDVAERVGATVGIEPVAVHTLNTPELARQMLHDIASPSLRIIFDFVNLITPENMNDLDGVLGRAMDCFGDRLCAIHVKDCTFDGHQFANAQLGTGIVDWHKAVKSIYAANPNVCLLREGVWPGAALEEAAYLRGLVDTLDKA